MPEKINISYILTESKKLGLDLVSHCGVEELEKDREHLTAWQESGYAAEMGFMQRDPYLLSNPLAILPEARSVLVFALHYERTPLPAFETGFGRVARYAWGRDYHRVIKKRLGNLMLNLERGTNRTINYRIFSDAVPLLERALARTAGMGFIGKNSMLIRPGEGSYFFLAEVLCDLELQERPLEVINAGCGSCSRCIGKCPTSAIVSDHVIDAGKCISYLTIEKKGALDSHERPAIGEWIFGCDICQEVCPFNHSSLKREKSASLSEFGRGQGAGPMLSLSRLLSIRTRDEFLKHFAGTALMRAGRESLLRNAAIVAANTAADSVTACLIEAFNADSSEVVRAASLWAIFDLHRKMGCLTQSASKALINRAMTDCQLVRDEIKFCHV